MRIGPVFELMIDGPNSRRMRQRHEPTAVTTPVTAPGRCAAANWRTADRRAEDRNESRLSKRSGLEIDPPQPFAETQAHVLDHLDQRRWPRPRAERHTGGWRAHAV